MLFRVIKGGTPLFICLSIHRTLVFSFRQSFYMHIARGTLVIYLFLYFVIDLNFLLAIGNWLNVKILEYFNSLTIKRCFFIFSPQITFFDSGVRTHFRMICNLTMFHYKSNDYNEIMDNSIYGFLLYLKLCQCVFTTVN